MRAAYRFPSTLRGRMNGAAPAPIVATSVPGGEVRLGLSTGPGYWVKSQDVV